MPSVNRPDDGVQALARFIRDIVRRLDNLERRTKKAERSSQEEHAPYSHSGPVTIPASWTSLSGWPVRRGGQVVVVNMTASTAAGGDSTFQLRVNGTVVGSTVTFPASATVASDYAGDVRVPAGTSLVLEPLTIGSGLEGFGAVVVMKG